MKRISTYRIEIVVLLAEIVYMTLELVAARIMSPFFGNTNAVWTAVIGVILISSAIGNWIGGKLADGKYPTTAFSLVLWGAAITIALLPVGSSIVLPFLACLPIDVRIGATCATTLFFFIPSLLLGTITPIAIKLKMESLDTAGAITGGIYAIATIGGIIGTFLTGFFLIPYFSTPHILYISAFLVSILPFILPPPHQDEAMTNLLALRIIEAISAVVILIISVVSIIAPPSITSAFKGETVIYETDSEYNKLQVISLPGAYNGEDLRLLKVGINGFQSISYASEEKKYDLPLGDNYYTIFYDRAFDSGYVHDADSATNSLMIGGGGYAYPRHYISTYPNKKMNVVEIDPEVTEIAKKYFFLDDLIEEYDLAAGLDGSGRLGLICDDGRMLLARTAQDAPGSYDRIFNDAFSGLTPPASITTVEAARLIQQCLDDDGIYFTNVIGSVSGDNSRFLKAEVATLSQVFKHVYLFPSKPEGTPVNETASSNWMVVATDADTKFEQIAYPIDISDAIVLTDDYCPVENLSASE